MPLYWKVVLVNGAVLCVAAVGLVLAPVTVSRQAVLAEVVVVVVGLLAVLLTNALLLRSSLGPVDRVVRVMGSLDAPELGHRLSEDRGGGPGPVLVRSWNRMLDRLESERRTSNARALAAQEAERHRIAQELHDEVGQSLTVVLLGLKRLESRAPADLVEELTLVRESARAGLDDVRRVARRLRPGVLDDLGLRSALAALATDFSSLGGARLRKTVAPGLPDLSPEVELVIYRIAQEALTNTARHAHATHVELSLSRIGDHVVLEVVDDGRGTDGTAPGAGLLGMQERALLVGADVSVTGGPARGTRVRLSVPIGTGAVAP